MFAFNLLAPLKSIDLLFSYLIFIQLTLLTKRANYSAIYIMFSRQTT